MAVATYISPTLFIELYNTPSYNGGTIYTALSTTDPATSVTEPVGNNYSRVAVTQATLISAATAVAPTTITFPTASGSWGTLTYFAFYDASSGGNLLAYGTLDTPLTIGNGNTASFSYSIYTYHTVRNAPAEFAQMRS